MRQTMELMGNGNIKICSFTYASLKVSNHTDTGEKL